jgi:hypothetical protein
MDSGIFPVAVSLNFKADVIRRIEYIPVFADRIMEPDHLTMTFHSGEVGIKAMPLHLREILIGFKFLPADMLVPGKDSQKSTYSCNTV